MENKIFIKLMKTDLKLKTLLLTNIVANSYLILTQLILKLLVVIRETKAKHS